MSAFEVEFEATVAEPVGDVRAAINRVGTTPSLQTSADQTTFSGRARIAAETSEEAMRKLRDAIEDEVSRSDTTLDLKLRNAHQVSG